jgi:hypothetical protein
MKQSLSTDELSPKQFQTTFVPDHPPSGFVLREVGALLQFPPMWLLLPGHGQLVLSSRPLELFYFMVLCDK